MASFTTVVHDWVLQLPPQEAPVAIALEHRFHNGSLEYSPFQLSVLHIDQMTLTIKLIIDLWPKWCVGHVSVWWGRGTWNCEKKWRKGLGTTDWQMLFHPQVLVFNQNSSINRPLISLMTCWFCEYCLWTGNPAPGLHLNRLWWLNLFYVCLPYFSCHMT